MGVMGWDLYSTLQEQAQYYVYYQSTLPMACPRCGEPLREGPTNQPGVLYCRYDFWQYPENYDPVVDGGM